MFRSQHLVLLDVQPKSELELLFTLENPSKETVRIVGFTDTCGQNACIHVQSDLPINVAPKSSFDIVCRLKVSQPGPFKVETCCFLADPHFREVELKVSGTVNTMTSSHGGGRSP